MIRGRDACAGRTLPDAWQMDGAAVALIEQLVAAYSVDRPTNMALKACKSSARHAEQFRHVPRPKSFSSDNSAQSITCVS